MASLQLTSILSSYTPLDMDPVPPTSYSSFVLDVFKRTKPSKSDSDSAPSTTTAPLINQAILRHSLGLASSFLITDLTTNPENGYSTWLTGFSNLVDIVVVLHTRNDLELETMSEASKACSECWTAAGAWKGMEDCRVGVRTIAGKLRKLLDEGGRTYRGEPVSILVYYLPASDYQRVADCFTKACDLIDTNFEQPITDDRRMTIIKIVGSRTLVTLCRAVYIIYLLTNGEVDLIILESAL
ncbi:hypothetical protein Agabi119p4_5053 [Agaricus bisporus var. burnettii]|uniref:Uncharacterized protein n=1 Tax=Agaricus bisporus var. burnettii TaxID=192524 RepID=A0A8H7F4D5_AGABI|nr:hypothetical protein Agabi119p4_5053 [Agaricus bisporus var. burnettii]